MHVVQQVKLIAEKIKRQTALEHWNCPLAVQSPAVDVFELYVLTHFSTGVK